MRGGSLPLLGWAALNLVLLIGDWVWQGPQLGVALTAFTVLVINAFAFVYWLLRRDAVRRGAPAYRSDPEALPRVSVASAGAGVSVGLILFGIVFGKFLVYVGGALLIFTLGRLLRELSWQRRTMRGIERGGEP